MPHAIPALLQTDPLRYIDMTEPLRLGSATLLCDRPDGVLLHERASGAHMMAATNVDAARQMLDTLPAATLFVAHEAFLLPLVADRFGLSLDIACLQAAYLRPAPPAVDAIPYAIRPATPADVPAIQQRYAYDLGPDYILARIHAGDMLGVYDGDTLAAFGGFHPEGSMGMLSVAPAYRRRHIGEALTARLIAHQQARGRVPFSQVAPDNAASLRMHEKLGFARTDALLYWLD